MKTLWFKGKYVHPILSGSKTDTVRKNSNRLPNEGEQVKLTVGPRPAFAIAVVDSIESANELPEWRRKQVVECLSDLPEDPVMINFSVTHIPE